MEGKVAITNITVTMQWNETAQKYLMKREDGLLIYDYWDCGNVRKMFKDISKEQNIKYRVTIEKLEE